MWHRKKNIRELPKVFICCLGFPGGSEGKASAYSAGDLGSIPGSGRSPGEGNGNPVQYSCLENPMDRGAWWATVHGIAKSQTRLSDFTSLTNIWLFVTPRTLRVLQWVTISFSREFSWPKDWTHIFCIGRQILLPLCHQGGPRCS